MDERSMHGKPEKAPGMLARGQDPPTFHRGDMRQPALLGPSSANMVPIWRCVVRRGGQARVTRDA